MKTITISVMSQWIDEPRQRELEQSLKSEPFIKGFEFNGKGDLEVSFEYDDRESFIRDLCGLKIQLAIRQSLP
jgi:hypothetical protein